MFYETVLDKQRAEEFLEKLKSLGDDNFRETDEENITEDEDSKEKIFSLHIRINNISQEMGIEVVKTRPSSFVATWANPEGISLFYPLDTNSDDLPETFVYYKFFNENPSVKEIKEARKFVFKSMDKVRKLTSKGYSHQKICGEMKRIMNKKGDGK